MGTFRHLNFDIHTIAAVLQYVASQFLKDIETIFRHPPLLYDKYQEGRLLLKCSFFYGKTDLSKVLITLVAFIGISWVKQCRRNESCSVEGWTMSMAVLLPPSGARRN